MNEFLITFLLMQLFCTQVWCISEIPNSLLVEMQSVNSTKDFYQRFVDGGYRSYQGDQEDSSGIDTEEPEEALGNCQPLETTAKVPPPSNAVWLTHPECVKIKQCGGCCGSLSTSCQPTKREKRNYRVSHFKYNVEKRLLEVVKEEILSLYEHTACGCQCKTKASDCTEDQFFDERLCECVCKNSDEITDCIAADKIWDVKKCQCMCKETEECSSGYIFDPLTCKCETIGHP